MPQGETVNEMFAGIAEQYDLANHLLSGGMDFLWRRRLVKMVKAVKPRKVLDLATGSGDVAFALAKGLGPEVEIDGLDFCLPMLAIADEKKQERTFAENVTFGFGDCLSLPLEDDSVDVITIAFGLRNLEDRKRGLEEMRRALRPGGALFVLEFTQPQAFFRPFYYVYLKYVLPLAAAAVTRKKDAYDYLACSIEGFPSVEEISRELEEAGFKGVAARGLTFRTVAIHHCTV